ncbi:MAG: DUF2281 domain-containing protein [Myxococcota bacterium]|jgi:hypothetical protein
MTVKQAIWNEIDKMPDNLLTEVLDFVRFIENRKQAETLARSASAASQPSFDKVWDNKEDAVYDKL